MKHQLFKSNAIPQETQSGNDGIAHIQYACAYNVIHLSIKKLNPVPSFVRYDIPIHLQTQRKENEIGIHIPRRRMVYLEHHCFLGFLIIIFLSLPLEYTVGLFLSCLMCSLMRHMLSVKAS